MLIKENHKHPTYWGPSAWKFLHSVADSYPQHPTDEMKQKSKQFFFLLKDMLPCPSCRMNYERHLMKHPITDETVRTTETLSRWLINIHNEVNMMNNKPIFTYEQIKKSKTKDVNFTNFIIVVLMILVLLLFVFFAVK